MTRYTYLNSPIQPLLLTSDGDALTGLFMVEVGSPKAKRRERRINTFAMEPPKS